VLDCQAGLRQTLLQRACVDHACIFMVALVSNISHYYYTARALLGKNLLQHYITSWCLLSGEEPPFWMPALYRRKLESRRYVDLPCSRMHRLRLPELLQKALPQLKLASSLRATDICNELFDERASHKLQKSKTWNILHFVNTIGLKCARQAQSRGCLVVYDSRQEHPVLQNRVVDEECQRWGITPPLENGTIRDRMIEELQTAHHVIVPSEYAKRTFVDQGTPAERIHVVPYGVNTDLFLTKAKAKSTKMRLLFVGRLCVRKGIVNLLEAIRRLGTVNVRLTCIGQIDPAVSRRLQEYSELFEHKESVANIDLPKYYADADLFVLPSVADAYPLVVLEALSAGLPVISTTNVGSSELIRDGIEGSIVPPSDIDALSRAISRFLDYPDLLDETRTNVHNMRHLLTWDRYETTLQELYSSSFQRHLPAGTYGTHSHASLQ
jgi:alpha-maltose-1-phosphate synthase